MPTDLRGHAENVGVILDESSHASQTSQGSRRLVSVDDTKLRHPDREFFVASVPSVKDKTVTRTVHGLQRPLLLLDVENEHILLVVLPMAGRLPQLAVVHVGRDDCDNTSERIKEHKMRAHLLGNRA